MIISYLITTNGIGVIVSGFYPIYTGSECHWFVPGTVDPNE